MWGVGWFRGSEIGKRLRRRIGSYYYSNPNGSTYHNDGNGGSNYTAPGGKK